MRKRERGEYEVLQDRDEDTERWGETEKQENEKIIIEILVMAKRNKHEDRSKRRPRKN